MYKVIHDEPGGYVNVISDEEYDRVYGRLQRQPQIHADNLSREEAEAEARYVNAMTRRE